MSKNNQNFFSSAVVRSIIIILVVLILGYLLFKTSPKNSSSLGQSQTSTSVYNGDLNSLIGKTLPDIQLIDKDGKVYTNADFKGKNTVLFFSEGLMCYPACWNQIAALGTDSRFTTSDTQAFSVLMDPSADWQKAIAKMPELALSKTLFDVDGSVSRKFGLLTLPSSMHRGILPGHTYIVLDKIGIVRYVNDDPNMAVANNFLISEMAGYNK